MTTPDQAAGHALATNAVHAGHVPDPTTNSRGVPIHLTTSYTFNSTEHAANLFALKEFGNVYSRIMNPTTDVLEQRLTALEGGVGALAVSSGHHAVFNTIATLARSGDNIISSKSLYGGTWNLFNHTLKRFGIEVRFFDAANPDQIAGLADDRTRLVFTETIGNPANDIPDIQAIADQAHAIGVPLVADNTALTPALFKPFEHGVDISVYSLTKFLGGHGTHIGGAIVDSGKFDWTVEPERWPEFNAPDPSYNGIVYTEALKPIGNISFIIRARVHGLRDLGGTLSPFASWIFLQGIETLHLRVPRHAENALAVARHLADHPAVEWVNYPGLETAPTHANAKKYLTGGFGAIVGFGIKGGAESGKKFIESLELFSHLANIGDAKSLAIHPASTTHSQLTDEELPATGVTPDYVRLSVGLEAIEDITRDLDQALAKAVAPTPVNA